jgi:DNA invertase Pin-like site-specific DNA recombinase
MTVHAAIYARTSPDCLLSEDEQIERLRTIAAERGWTITSVLSDHPTTVRKGQDRRLGELALIEAIQTRSIERVLVWSIDRMGKSLIDLIGIMETCRLAGTSLWVEEQKLDTATSNGMSLFDVTSMMALHLRQTRRDRILRGQAAARALSIKFGRPTLSVPKVERAKQGLAAGKGVREIARLSGISPTSVCRIKNSMSTEVARP